jgi:hypothetical protein
MLSDGAKQFIMGEHWGFVMFLVTLYTLQSHGQPFGQREIDSLVKIELEKVSILDLHISYPTHAVIEPRMIRLGEGHDKFARTLVAGDHAHTSFFEAIGPHKRDKLVE